MNATTTIYCRGGQSAAREPHATRFLVLCGSFIQFEDYFLDIFTLLEFNTIYLCERKVWGWFSCTPISLMWLFVVSQ